MLLHSSIIEVEVEVSRCVGRIKTTIIEDILNDRGAQNSFAAPGDSVQP